MAAVADPPSRPLAERLLPDGRREPVLLVGSVCGIVSAGLAIWLDGRAAPPAAMVMILALIVVGLAAPARTVLLVGALAVVASLAGSLAAVGASSLLVSVSLAVAASMSAWQAADRDRRQAEVVRLTQTDALTGCLNRRGFGDVLDRAIAHSGRFGLITFDLDGFKRVNDVDGHAAGDALLCWTADTLRDAVEPEGSVGRIGGDEFAVLLPAASRGRAMEVGERLREELGRRASATAGVASMPADGSTAEELFRQADSELSASKRRRAAYAATAGEVLVSAAPARAAAPTPRGTPAPS